MLFEKLGAKSQASQRLFAPSEGACAHQTLRYFPTKKLLPIPPIATPVARKQR